MIQCIGEKYRGLFPHVFSQQAQVRKSKLAFVCRWYAYIVMSCVGTTSVHTGTRSVERFCAQDPMVLCRYGALCFYRFQKNTVVIVIAWHEILCVCRG